MTSSLTATHLLAESTTTIASTSTDLNVKPVEPPFVQELFHHGIVVWWIFIVAGVIAVIAAGAAAVTDSPNVPANVRLGGGLVAAAFIALGSFFVSLSY